MIVILSAPPLFHPYNTSADMHRIGPRLPYRVFTQRPIVPARARVLTPSPLTRYCLSCRLISSTPVLLKKKDKTKASVAEPPLTSSDASEDPYHLSQLEIGIKTALARLKDDLSNLRAGGRFNTASLEGLKVQLGKDAHDSIRLRDLAQVVPKGGRVVAILVAEEEHIKPVTSAIVSSNLSLTPQSDPHNPLQLNIPIPPPTKESRDQSVQAAKQALEKAANAVRDSRGATHKRLQDMQKKKLARPDDVRKAHDQMEKTADKGQKEAKDLFDDAKKMLEQV
ncbi:hypothetical protein N7468_001943 [Penicillium chermesinum]|uniref:Ribosome recycling factor domain-containing protein n=1 Tax=Penicillium chermesinum TaxID=63820 RepID=A0A9W9PHP5_9EURO|nr:uncharacterized protein N7468_001943 [Penicillium chermesinum]KAJ5246960.1 hypothetical protein N7468_001943 [Penicillium chermesinum]KAJ6145212.1 hypothetical protein N7470_009107 [Penicillium chermesinum]